MDVNKLMSSMQGTDYEAILKNLESMGGPMKNALMIASVLSIVIGLLWCFFGLKLIRVWAAILGLALGFGIGTGVAAAFNLSSNLILICGAVGGILLAILGAVFYHVGVFLIAWITGSSLALLVLRPKDWKLALACAGIGLEAGPGMSGHWPGCGTVYDPLCGTDHHRDHRYQRRNECRHGNHILSAV